MLRLFAVLSLAVVPSLGSWVSRAEAQRMHTVRRGQSLAAIAHRNHVSVWDLAAANRMRPRDPLRVGRVLEVPSRGEVFVRPGQTLSHIARAHHCTVRELQRANRLRPGAHIRAGQRLRLPGFEALAHTARRSWGAPEAPGVVRFSSRDGRTALVPLRDASGAVLARGLDTLGRLMTRADEVPEDDVRRPHARLALLLASISDHFGGRPVRLISGFREVGGHTRETSRHVSGRALDVQVLGVPRRAVWDYCRSLARTGCGLYPRSVFIHVDVREREAQWVDWSGHGRRARYGNLRGPFPRSRRGRRRARHVGRRITRPDEVPLEVEVVRQGWVSGFVAPDESGG